VQRKCKAGEGNLCFYVVSVSEDKKSSRKERSIEGLTTRLVEKIRKTLVPVHFRELPRAEGLVVF